MWSPTILPSGPTEEAEPDPQKWAALHPILGEVFMATIAAAAAQDEGLEIVTDSSYVHGVVSRRDEETIYQALIHDGSRASLPDSAATLRLAHLVIVGGFDVSSLTAEDLALMSKNREALFDFRRYLADRVAEIPQMDNQSRREDRLKAIAAEALDEWRKKLTTMSRFARRFFGFGLLDKSERAMTDLAKALIPASLTSVATAAAAPAGGAAALVASPLIIAAAPGLAIGMAIYGAKTWNGLKQEEVSGPLRYLSLLKRQGATLLMAMPPSNEEDPRLR